MRQAFWAAALAMGLSGEARAEVDPGTTDAGFSVYAAVKDDGKTVLGVMLVTGKDDIAGGWQKESLYALFYNPDSAVDLDKLINHTNNLNMNNHSMCSGGSPGVWPSSTGDKFRLYRILESDQTSLPGGSNNQVFSCGPTDLYQYAAGDINIDNPQPQGNISVPAGGQMYKVKYHQSSGVDDLGYLKHRAAPDDKVKWYVNQSQIGHLSGNGNDHQVIDLPVSTLQDKTNYLKLIYKGTSVTTPEDYFSRGDLQQNTPD